MDIVDRTSITRCSRTNAMNFHHVDKTRGVWLNRREKRDRSLTLPAVAL